MSETYYIENPLDNFRSYSYHHILLVSNNSEALRELTSNGNAGFLSKITGAQLGQDISNGVFLLVDTRKTSEFQIESLNYDAYITAGKSIRTPTDNIIIGSLITMRLIDPSGIGFFNYMHYLIHEKLMTDVTGLQFLLHTVFVGHDDDGNTRYLPEHSITIPLIMAGEFNLAEFGIKGGLYDISFACANNGSAHLLNNVSYLPEVIDIRATDNLLGTAIQSLENQLNLKSKEFYLHYNPQYKNSDGSVSGDNSLGSENGKNKNNGRLVQYMITIPETWFYYWVDVHQVNSEEIDWVKKKQETRESQASTNEEKEPTPEQTSYDALLSTAQGMSIADVLGMIFKNTNEVNKMFNLDAKKDGTGKCYKILTSITSNEETVMVHYDVAEYELPDVNQQAKIKEATKNSVPKRDNGITPQNAVEYDYLFSGKNSHIIEMEIKANNLFVALMSSTSGGAAACQKIQEENQKQKPDISPAELKVDLNECLPMQPLCRPSITNSQAVNLAPNINKQLPQTKTRAENIQHFHRALADLNAVSIQPNVKIRGNPALISRYTIEPIPPHISYYGKIQDFLNASSKEDVYNDKETSWEYDVNSRKKVTAANPVTKAHVDHRTFIEENHLKQVRNDLAAMKQGATAADNKSYLAGGTWVKINIFAPRDYPFNRGATSSDDNVNSYKQQFFYDSWYLLAKISNVFSGGSFTQELQLLSYDLYGKYGIKPRSGAETPQ